MFSNNVGLHLNISSLKKT